MHSETLNKARFRLCLFQISSGVRGQTAPGGRPKARDQAAAADGSASATISIMIRFSSKSFGV